MRVASLDIGICNLSYCVLEKKNDSVCVLHWGVIDLFEDSKQGCCVKLKNNKSCSQPARWKLGENKYCKKHAPSSSKKQKKKKYTTFEYASAIKKKFDLIKHYFDGINTVLIENQPVGLNPVMKTIQILVFAYFAYHNSNWNVVNVNARAKEKFAEKDLTWKNSEYWRCYENTCVSTKNKYRRRKQLCYHYCRYCLRKETHWSEYLQNYKKKDDLSDAFVMCFEHCLKSKNT